VLTKKMSVRTRLEKKGFRAADFDNTDFFFRVGTLPLFTECTLKCRDFIMQISERHWIFVFSIFQVFCVTFNGVVMVSVVFSFS
jgi:hypothetical protein